MEMLGVIKEKQLENKLSLMCYQKAWEISH